MGDVAGRLCIITDDMIDTAGTICAAAELLVERGATRGVGDGHARRAVRPGDRPAEEQPARADHPHQHAPAAAARSRLDKIEVLSVAPLIAEALGAVFDDTSVSDIFDGENLA